MIRFYRHPTAALQYVIYIWEQGLTAELICKIHHAFDMKLWWKVLWCSLFYPDGAPCFGRCPRRPQTPRCARVLATSDCLQREEKPKKMMIHTRSRCLNSTTRYLCIAKIVPFANAYQLGQVGATATTRVWAGFRTFWNNCAKLETNCFSHIKTKSICAHGQLFQLNSRTKPPTPANHSSVRVDMIA